MVTKCDSEVVVAFNDGRSEVLVAGCDKKGILLLEGAEGTMLVWQQVCLSISAAEEFVKFGIEFVDTFIDNFRWLDPRWWGPFRGDVQFGVVVCVVGRAAISKVESEMD